MATVVFGHCLLENVRPEIPLHNVLVKHHPADNFHGIALQQLGDLHGLLDAQYAGGTGNEVQVDDRQNILKNPKVWIFLFMIVFGGIGSVWGVLHFFNRGAAPAPVAQQPVNGAPAGQAGSSTPSASPAASQAFSSDWRIAGEIVVNNQRQVVLVNGDGVVRYEHPSNFRNSGRVMTGDLDGQRVSRCRTSGA